MLDHQQRMALSLLASAIFGLVWLHTAHQRSVQFASAHSRPVSTKLSEPAEQDFEVTVDPLYAKGWRILHKPNTILNHPDSTVEFAAPAENAFGLIIAEKLSARMITQVASTRLAIDSIVDAALVKPRSLLDQFKLLSHSTTKLDGMTTHRLTYSGKLQGHPFTYLSYVAMADNNRVYQFLFWSFSKRYTALESDFETIVASFKRL